MNDKSEVYSVGSFMNLTFSHVLTMQQGSLVVQHSLRASGSPRFDSQPSQTKDFKLVVEAPKCQMLDISIYLLKERLLCKFYKKD